MIFVTMAPGTPSLDASRAIASVPATTFVVSWPGSLVPGRGAWSVPVLMVDEFWHAPAEAQGEQPQRQAD